MKRILVVEDSPTARRYLVTLLTQAGDFEVVGQARTGEEAVKAAAALEPDLVSLDVFLPDLTAAEVVRRLSAYRPVPVILLSDARRDADDVFRALEAGAVDFLPKPKPDDAAATAAMLAALREVREVARARGEPAPAPFAAAPARPAAAVVAIASSTGGPPALRALLAALPKDFSLPVLVAQHLTPGFEDGLTRWLGEVCALPVRVVSGPTALGRGVFVGRPQHDLLVTSATEATSVPAPGRGYHPSGDLLFESAAAVFGARVAAVVLSGVGADGLKGATRVQQAGGVVLAQSLASAAVKGMPQSVIRAGLTSGEGSPQVLAARLGFLAVGHG